MTRRIIIPFLSIVVSLMLLSCGDGGYKVNGDKVSYEYWTFSFGTQKQMD